MDPKREKAEQQNEQTTTYMHLSILHVCRFVNTIKEKKKKNSSIFTSHLHSLPGGTSGGYPRARPGCAHPPLEATRTRRSGPRSKPCTPPAPGSTCPCRKTQQEKAEDAGGTRGKIGVSNHVRNFTWTTKTKNKNKNKK